jgi:Protein of unknown function (DUF4007)
LPPHERKFRISGHESFPCRYAWLPKAVRGLQRNSELFADEEGAMVELGVGKNMARSIRFWAQATGMASAEKSGKYRLTHLGSSLLTERGLDPFLEDVRTLWLLHWNLSTDAKNPLLAWDFLLNRWQDPELVPSSALKALRREATKQNDKISAATIEQHLTAFLHTYVPTRGKKGEVQEDNLDCPLVELEFLTKVGDREIDRTNGRREPIYAFRREEKPEITPELFAYCLLDFWGKRHKAELTLPFREVAHGHGSPGQIFKLPEEDVRTRLEALAKQSGGSMVYGESAASQQVRKERELRPSLLLLKIYKAELINA